MEALLISETLNVLSLDKIIWKDTEQNYLSCFALVRDRVNFPINHRHLEAVC